MFRTMKCKEHDHSSFYKFLQMEKNHKNTDCYFFYYSTCTKGDNCAYRHEASALGCETVCSYWQQGKCLNQHCNFRHMEIKKNRKVIPCYWEKLSTGCKKPHCSFMHRLSRTGITNPIEPVKTTTAPVKPVNQEWSNRPDAKFDGNSTESEQGRGSSEAGSFIGSPVVDPLIVNFDEESDSESAPSPRKSARNRVVSCKTYEEIRLEEIQAESAAFYSYGPPGNEDSAAGKIKKITEAKGQRIALDASIYAEKAPRKETEELNFKVLSLEEIRRRKKNEIPTEKIARKVAVVPAQKKEKPDHGLAKIVIKTLDELRADNKITVEKMTSEKIRKKRRYAEVEKSEEKVPAQSIGAKVPPVRLKRRRMINVAKDVDDKTIDDEKNENIKKDEEDRRANERLEDKATEELVNKRQSVEVRLCDSSTDDGKSSTTESTTHDDEKIKLSGNSKNIVESPANLCDSILKLDKTEIIDMSIDTASDDILKDIDALLTDDIKF